MKCVRKRLTGISIPLGALRSKKCGVIGEYTTLLDFASFAKRCGLGLIQLLPVNDTGTQSSPYSGLSAFALHPIYIDISALPEYKEAIKSDANFKILYDDFVHKFTNNAAAARYDYEQILEKKQLLLQKLYEKTSLFQTGVVSKVVEEWIKDNDWVVPYSVYKMLKYKYMQASWKEWRTEDTGLSLEEIKKRYRNNQKECLLYVWVQFRAFEQFKRVCNEVYDMGLVLKGDMPILMNEDSCDAWAYPTVFNQDYKAGSPVDDENPTGQNWGFPTYNWDELEKNNYSWWIKRLKVAEQFYGAYRLDHVLGFFRIFSIPNKDSNALLGHVEPYVAIGRDMLHNSGFDDNRIRWLSEPHIPTSVIEYITWNHEAAVNIMNTLATRVNNEELWIFKESIKGDKDIRNADISKYCQGGSDVRVKEILCRYWSDRCLLEIKPNSFIPMWTYFNSTSWKSLSWDEQNKLKMLYNWQDDAQNKLWEAHSSKILGALTHSVNMIPCGEDLGAELKCLPHVLTDNGILALRVNRWARDWKNEPVKPYINIKSLPYLSVTTSSVHDSSTLREWWDTDKSAVALFVRTYYWAFGIGEWDNAAINRVTYTKFNSYIAASYLKALASSNSIWAIHPFQDFIGLEDKYLLPNAKDERINTPGTVNKFNWTYKMPCDIETLLKDNALVEKIATVCRARG